MAHKQMIIIPGIMGSELQHKEYKVWPPHVGTWLKDFNIVATRLEDIKNDDIESVALCGKYYNGLIRYSQSLVDEVTVFHYDWRQNNFNHIERLAKIINKKADEIVIVAHSMGGIIAKLFLTAKENEEVVKKVTKLITLGTPWNGAAESHVKLKFGMGKAFIRSRFKYVIPKFESVYQLLPNREYIESSTIRFAFNYLNNKNWEQICREYYEPILKKNGLDYDEVLGRLYIKMQVELPSNIEHHSIIGYDFKTLVSIKYEGVNLKGKYGDGDSTVPLSSAITNTKHKYFIKSKHGDLPKNRQVQSILKLVLTYNEMSEKIINKLDLLTYDEILNRKFKLKLKILRKFKTMPVAFV